MTIEKQPEEKIRVVLDTNVYISIFTSPRGQLRTIWEHALKGTFTLLISPAIVAELAGVLRVKFQWPSEEVTARAKRFARIAEIITPKTIPTIIKSDPADNQILACALAGNANLIISGDRRHLLPLKEYEGIPIIAPVNFLRMLGGL
jgi:putative PIN family toxin of toxin-antitoxin system